MYMYIFPVFRRVTTSSKAHNGPKLQISVSNLKSDSETDDCETMKVMNRTKDSGVTLKFGE